MRKFTDFIVNKRHIILTIFIILSIISIILASKVNINYDIAKYLPSTSETRIGMDIMEKEFKEINKSSLNVMFEGLQQNQKGEIYNELTQINGVSSVDYDETENYNKDNYTLYVINVDDAEDSKVATDVYNKIKSNYEDYPIYTSGAIDNRNNPVLPTWIVALAVGCAMVILVIMCESYVEPFLFLTSILIAVILNNGSNIIFGTVSNITSSISAILQMALSMDYSIMLMNRYDQEKQKEKDKVKAMKNALYNAFTAISSSSVTTIVGLLALVFMSFTIGRDLGLVLAKGVLFSLISIFFVLPALILMFDKLIVKTKKKSPNFKTSGLGKISYKLRHIALILFVIAFIGCYAIKGNLGISYTDTTSNKISEVFGQNNQMALIYNCEDEETVAKYLQTLEQEENVEEVLGYGNTINQSLTYDKLNEKLNELGADTRVEDYLLKIIYYNYYNQDENNKMSFDEFVNFVQEDVYKNEEVAEKIDEETKSNINRLANFTNNTQMNKTRSISEIASILGINETDVKDILIYYNSKNNNIKISLSEFINFMKKDVLTNEKYASKVNNSAKNSLNKLQKFTNATTIQTKVTSDEMAKLFEMPKDTMKELYAYYISVNEINTKMTIAEFSNFVVTEVLTVPAYSNRFDENTINNIKILQLFSNNEIIKKDMNSKELADLFGIEEKTIKSVLLLKHLNTDNGTKLSIAEFVKSTVYLKNNTSYLDNIDISELEKIDKSLLGNKEKYTASQMAKLLNMDNRQICNIYALIDFVNNKTSNWVMTPNQLVTMLLKESSKLDQTTTAKLQLLSNIMKNTIEKTKYSYKELSEFIGIEETKIKDIYILYTVNNTNNKLSPEEFVKFVLEHKSDASLSELNESTIEQLNLLQKAMNGVISGKKYSSQELGTLLKININDAKLLYGLYSIKYVNTNPKMSLKQFVDFILEDVLENPEYARNFNEEKKLKLNTINAIMNASLNNIKYTKNESFAILSNLANNIDKNQLELLYVYYGSTKEYKDDWTLTVEQFVNYLNDEILQDSRFEDFIDDKMKQSIVEAKEPIKEAKELLVGNKYSRVVINTKMEPETDITFNFIQKIKDEIGSKLDHFYIIGDSPMAYEMSKTFQSELNFITILTMIAIFIVVAITFKSAILPLILVLIIQCAVYMTMGILSFTGEKVYFIALLIVQSILMGATIDYAILYTSYYIENRKTMGIKEAIISSYSKSMHTILTSASILIIVTLIVGYFTNAVAARICKTISQGTLCSAILILVLLPAVLASCDKVIIKKKD